MENFYAAARRHFDAADVLYQSGAQAIEASHLYAYAAECVLKAVLAKQGKAIRGHINDHLSAPQRVKPKPDPVAEYQSLQTGRSAKPLPPRSDWFKGWSVEARYSDGSEIVPYLAAHKQDADVFRKLLFAANPANVI